MLFKGSLIHQQVRFATLFYKQWERDPNELLEYNELIITYITTIITYVIVCTSYDSSLRIKVVGIEYNDISLIYYRATLEDPSGCPFRSCCSRSRRSQDASLLPLWRFSQYWYIHNNHPQHCIYTSYCSPLAPIQIM